MPATEKNIFKTGGEKKKQGETDSLVWIRLQGVPVDAWRVTSKRSKMSWLSPVQWAKWTWSAVRGGGEEEDETDLGMDDEALTEEAMPRDQEDDERSHGCRQV